MSPSRTAHTSPWADDVAQEVANLIGGDCVAKYGAAPDTVVVDGVSYTPVLPPS